MVKKKILVIDDTVPILTMLKMMLERKGYEVTTRENTEGLTLLIDELQPALLIMDVLLSGVDGRDVCVDLRKIERFCKLPILMISALHDAGPDCVAAGAQFFLSKPFDLANFYFTVDMALTVFKNVEI